MTKRQNKRYRVKALRRLLNRNPEFFTQMSNGKKPYKVNGIGFSGHGMKENWKNEE